ncbi:MAG: nicotinamide-nucleotide amidohydrolase family protein [Pseudomonadota bacterium]
MTGADVLSLFRARGWTLTAAESCTGGLVMAALTDVPGSSDVVDRGFVTYSNAAKQELLGVNAETLARFGAVSEPVAAEMAAGALDRSTADVAVSVTGIAGPGGGSAEKPVGTVAFGLATPDRVTAETVRFGSLGRSEIRRVAVAHALALLVKA